MVLIMLVHCLRLSILRYIFFAHFVYSVRLAYAPFFISVRVYAQHCVTSCPPLRRVWNVHVNLRLCVVSHLFKRPHV